MSSTASGLIATRDQRDFIEEAVVTLASEVDEVVVVDDGSVDGTWELLASLRDKRLTLLRNERSIGVSASFNRAAREATGDLLLIQGGDDRTLPGRAARQREALEDPTSALVFSLPEIIDGAGRVLPGELGTEFAAGALVQDPLAHLYFESNYICAPSVAVRASDYRELGGFRSGLDLLQDFALWLDLAERGRFVLLDPPVVQYRKHGTNLSREYASLDGPKQRRLAAERGHVRTRFIRRAGPLALERLANVCGLDPSRFAMLPREDQITMIELSHSDRLVVRRGLDALFGMVGDGDTERLAAMGLGPGDLGWLSTTADHEELGAVTAALAAHKYRGA